MLLLHPCTTSFLRRDVKQKKKQEWGRDVLVQVKRGYNNFFGDRNGKMRTNISTLTVERERQGALKKFPSTWIFNLIILCKPCFIELACLVYIYSHNSWEDRQPKHYPLASAYVMYVHSVPGKLTPHSYKSKLQPSLHESHHRHHQND